ncbi:MAG: hypothetical protein WCC06_02680 [Candidatus Aminicenantales bacterium]
MRSKNPRNPAKKRNGKFLSAVAVVFLLASPLSAQENRSSKGRFFLTLSGYNLSFKGDLSQERILWHFEKAFFVPRISPANGIALGFGYKGENIFWDLIYLQSTHNAFLEGVQSTATFHAADINGKIILWEKFPLQPYILLGISIPWLKVQNGAEMFGIVYNAAYYGLGVNLGTGLYAPLGSRIFFNGGIILRLAGFLYAYGGGKGRDISTMQISYGGPDWGKMMRAPCLCLVLGLGFTL